MDESWFQGNRTFTVHVYCLLLVKLCNVLSTICFDSSQFPSLYKFLQTFLFHSHNLTTYIHHSLKKILFVTLRFKNQNKNPKVKTLSIKLLQKFRSTQAFTPKDHNFCKWYHLGEIWQLENVYVVKVKIHREAPRNHVFPLWCGIMVAFLYTEGIQLTAAHSGGRCSDLTQEEVQHQWRYNLYSQG